MSEDTQPKDLEWREVSARPSANKIPTVSPSNMVKVEGVDLVPYSTYRGYPIGIDTPNMSDSMKARPSVTVPTLLDTTLSSVHTNSISEGPGMKLITGDLGLALRNAPQGQPNILGQRAVNTRLDTGQLFTTPESPAPVKTPYKSFSGCDITCIVHVIGNDGITVPVVIGNAQTISYSIHREKFPVRALGTSGVRGFCRGGRTIAGTIVFTMFDREVLWELLQGYSMDTEYVDDSNQVSAKMYPLLDQLPPFDVTIYFSNEYGHNAFMVLYGLEIHDSGAVMSIDDMIVEQTVQYVARDMDILRPADMDNVVGTREIGGSLGTSNDEYINFLHYLKDRRRRIEGGEFDDVYGYDIPYDSAIFNATADRDRDILTIGAGDQITYLTGRRDFVGDQIVWYGKAYESGTDVLFYPDPAVHPYTTTDSKYKVYDSYVAGGDSTNLVSTNIPKQFLIPAEGEWVHPNYLRRGYTSGD
jgi:hypothetical protein